MAIYSCPRRYKLVVSCEHARNAIPTCYKNLFLQNETILSTHKAYDIGAYQIAKKLRSLADFFIAGRYSRLLIDLNRSLHHPNVFSEFTKINLSRLEKLRLIAKYYQPYREILFNEITNFIRQKNFVYHLSIHSFTPILDGVMRIGDIGLLYDPKRKYESFFSREFRWQLQKINKNYKIRYNYPYKGVADGFTTYMRKCFPDNKYCGIELELNQNLFGSETNKNKQLEEDIFNAVAMVWYSC